MLLTKLMILRIRNPHFIIRFFTNIGLQKMSLRQRVSLQGLCFNGCKGVTHWITFTYTIDIQDDILLYIGRFMFTYRKPSKITFRKLARKGFSKTFYCIFSQWLGEAKTFLSSSGKLILKMWKPHSQIGFDHKYRQEVPYQGQL